MFRCQCFKNCYYDSINIVVYIVIPETQYTITFRFEERRSFSIVFFLFKVLAAVQFDHEFLLWSAKIHDIRSNGMLAAEMDVVNAV